MKKMKTIQEINDYLWEISMKDIVKKMDAYMKDKGIEIITNPNPTTINDLKYPNNRSKIEQTKDS